jgi:uncharacterized membrane protein
VSKEQWLLALHVLGAFLFVGGALAAGLLQLAAMRLERPSEIASLLGLVRALVPAVGLGALLTLGLGLWLVDDRPFYEIGDAWIVAGLVLWTASGVLGQVGGTRARHARELAERLASEGDRPSAELRRALADPLTAALNWASMAALLATVGLMIWKPGG